MTFSWPENFYSDGIHGQLRRNPTKPDLGWLVSTKPAQVAGVFTQIHFQQPRCKSINKSFEVINRSMRFLLILRTRMLLRERPVWQMRMKRKS